MAGVSPSEMMRRASIFAASAASTAAPMSFCFPRYTQPATVFSSADAIPASSSASTVPVVLRAGFRGSLAAIFAPAQLFSS